jgi:hypothetical protein
MIYELLSWIQNDMPAIDEAHLTTALALVPPPPHSGVVNDRHSAGYAGRQCSSARLPPASKLKLSKLNLCL